MESYALRVKRQAMEKARAKLHAAILFRQLAWASVITALVMLFGAITLCAMDILTVGSAVAYGFGAAFIGIIAGGLMAYIDSENIDVIAARHTYENAQNDYFTEMEEA